MDKIKKYKKEYLTLAFAMLVPSFMGLVLLFHFLH